MPYKKCPHCKGESGFEITVRITGYLILKIDFDGHIMEEGKRNTYENEKYGKCLDCGKSITAASLDLPKIG